MAVPQGAALAADGRRRRGDGGVDARGGVAQRVEVA
jgi:hypothetical protein